MSYLIVGAGLIGSSIGLALRAAGEQVTLTDSNPRHVEAAVAMGAGQALGDRGTPGEESGFTLAVLAVPPQAVAAVYADARERTLAEVYTDVSSVKALPIAQVLAAGDGHDFVPSHPIAGRERGGPAAARRELFRGRPWAITPLAANPPAAIARVERLIELCRAEPVFLDPEVHDQAMALVSHGPHAAAAAVAAALAGDDAAKDDASAGGVREIAARLAGTGFGDTTRVAAGDSRLWTEIMLANGVALAPVLAALGERISGLADAVQRGDGEWVAALLRQGQRGRGLLPAKHGSGPRDLELAEVTVVVPDAPGSLGRLFTAAAGINIEDIAVDHAPSEPIGAVTLRVRRDAAAGLEAALAAAGFPTV